MARFTTLYSGSSGNSALVEENGRYLLVDMGKSCRMTQNALKGLGLPLADLGGILVTHEHSDHVSGLAIFLKYHPVPVYGSAATLDYLACRGLVPPGAELIDIDGRTTPLGRVAGVATDLGYVSDEVLANLLLADVVALEANYDYNMLMTGPYPYYLKTRIASQRGHLCNEENAATLVRLLENGCERFALCHISQENNTPELALESVRAALLGAGVVPGRDCVVNAARRHEVSPIIEF